MYEEYFAKAAQETGVDVNMLKAVAKTESDFDPNATSSAGAVGIMQLMPGTAKAMGVTDRTDPEQSIMGGAKYLSKLLDEFGGDEKAALAAYNAGPSNVRKYGKEKYSSYYDKVLSSYSGAGSSGSGSSGIQLKWWGDIVSVFLVVLCGVMALVFLYAAISSGSIKGVVKKVKKAV